MTDLGGYGVLTFPVFECCVREELLCEKWDYDHCHFCEAHCCPTEGRTVITDNSGGSRTIEVFQCGKCDVGWYEPL